MNVQKVVLGSTCNPYYLDFWPLVSKVWKLRFNIHPVLYLIHDNKETKVSNEFGDVIYVEPVNNVELSLQAQWIRYWAPSTELETTWMISDIDMIPINRKYFLETPKQYPDHMFINLNAQVIGGFPACYNIAKGKTFKDVLNLPDTFEQSLNNTKFWESNYPHTPENSNINAKYWAVDEMHSNGKISLYHDKSIFANPPRPGGFCKMRLDRLSWRFTDDEIRREYYMDAHCPRPYSSHKESIDGIINILLTT